MCIYATIIYCITCSYCKNSYIGETGRRLGDRFREHLRDVEGNARQIQTSRYTLDLPNHSKQHMAVCGLSLHLGNSGSRKILEQKFISQNGALNPHGINEHFSFNQWSKLSNCLRWPIYVMNSVAITKLPCYTRPPMQRHSSVETYPLYSVI